MRELVSFGAVGVLNSLVGYGIIYLCMLGFGWDPVPSNVAGYTLGLICSFVLNKRLTFRSQGSARHELVRFLLAFAVSYLLNLGVLLLSIDLLGIPAVWAQLLAGVAYTGCSFLLSKFFVFRTTHASRA